MHQCPIAHWKVGLHDLGLLKSLPTSAVTPDGVPIILPGGGIGCSV